MSSDYPRDPCFKPPFSHTCHSFLSSVSSPLPVWTVCCHIRTCACVQIAPSAVSRVYPWRLWSILLTLSLQRRCPGGDVENIFHPLWIKSPESSDALVAHRWKSTARCILRNLLAFLPIAPSHNCPYYHHHDYKSYQRRFLSSFLLHDLLRYTFSSTLSLDVQFFDV